MSGPGGLGAGPTDVDLPGLSSPPPHGPNVRARREGRLDPRSTIIALVSTLVVFGALGWLITSSAGWPRFERAFLKGEIFDISWPRQISALWVNVQLFLIAEALILPLALVIAVMRSLPGAVFFPLRVIATLYTDFFRGVPGILVIFMLGFGVPALQLPGVPNEPFFWGVVALTLLYSAYVAEVYRAGIQSVHPSQDAAARSLGLTHVQSLRYVVVPQAIRRVIPPLLNDFIGLQKDTALVSMIGVVEVFRQSQIQQSARFNFTPYLVTALIFLALTIPLARFTDWLVERDRRRSLAGRGRA